MATQNKAVKKTPVDRKNMLKTVTGQLNLSLIPLKIQLGEKEFKKRIKKAAKKLVAGIKKATVKKSISAAKKKVVLKKTKKNTSKR
jgi:Fic family protein